MGSPAGEQPWGRRGGQGDHKATSQGRDDDYTHAKISGQSPQRHLPGHFLSDLLSLPLDTMFGLHVTECYLPNLSREFYFLKTSSGPHFQNACFSLAGVNRSVCVRCAPDLTAFPGPPGSLGQAMSRPERGFQGSAGTRQSGVIKIIFRKQTA